MTGANIATNGGQYLQFCSSAVASAAAGTCHGGFSGRSHDDRRGIVLRGEGRICRDPG
jgi:hypothetical protein